MSNNKFQFIDVEDITDESIKENIEVVETPKKVGVEVSKSEEEKKPISMKKKIYFGFEARIIISLIAIIILFVGACFLGFKVINHTTIQEVNYIETGDFTYQVYSKDNTYQKENETYVADDVSIINVAFKYDSAYEKRIKVNNNYRVAAIISAYDKDEHSLLYQKDIDLVEKSPLNSSDNMYSVSKEVTAEYAKYKKLVSDYKDAERQVEIAFYIEENNETRKVSSLVVPFHKETFELNKYTTSRTTRVARTQVNAWDTYSLIYGIATSFLTIISLILIYRTTRLVLIVVNNKNEYEDALDNILKEYESIITIAGEGFESIVPEEKEVVKFDSFEELAKISEEINKPVIYSKINNVKCEFVLEDDKNLYKYVMKEADFTEDDKNKLENK